MTTQSQVGRNMLTKNVHMYFNKLSAYANKDWYTNQKWQSHKSQSARQVQFLKSTGERP